MQIEKQKAEMMKCSLCQKFGIMKKKKFGSSFCVVARSCGRGRGGNGVDARTHDLAVDASGAIRNGLEDD